MILKLRDNIYIGDKDAHKELKPEQVTSIIVVDDELEIKLPKAFKGIKVFKFPLSLKGINTSYVKDLATHTPKYLAQYGELVLIQSTTGLKRAAYIASRMICEVENKSIYEVMQEIKELEPKFDVGGAYL